MVVGTQVQQRGPVRDEPAQRGPLALTALEFARAVLTVAVGAILLAVITGLLSL